jgi:hypothetical protein
MKTQESMNFTDKNKPSNLAHKLSSAQDLGSLSDGYEEFCLLGCNGRVAKLCLLPASF